MTEPLAKTEEAREWRFAGRAAKFKDHLLLFFGNLDPTSVARPPLDDETPTIVRKCIGKRQAVEIEPADMFA